MGSRQGRLTLGTPRHPLSPQMRAAARQAGESRFEPAFSEDSRSCLDFSPDASAAPGPALAGSSCTVAAGFLPPYLSNCCAEGVTKAFLVPKGPEFPGVPLLLTEWGWIIHSQQLPNTGGHCGLEPAFSWGPSGPGCEPLDLWAPQESGAPQ